MHARNARSRKQVRSLGLLTDLYGLTMARGFWKSGMASRESVFRLFFRKAPFHIGYTVACGLEDALRFLRSLRFDDADIAYPGAID
jgi:nicotinate phosphoribosyltransferase